MTEGEEEGEEVTGDRPVLDYGRPEPKQPMLRTVSNIVVHVIVIVLYAILALLVVAAGLMFLRP